MFLKNPLIVQSVPFKDEDREGRVGGGNNKIHVEVSEDPITTAGTCR